MVLRIKLGLETSASKCNTIRVFYLFILTDVLEARVVCPHTEVRYENDDDVMTVGEEVICAVADLYDRVKHEVGGGM